MARKLPVWKVYKRGAICQWKIYKRGIFSAKSGIEKGKGSDLGAEPLRIKFFFSSLPRVCISNHALNISKFTIHVTFWSQRSVTEQFTEDPFYNMLTAKLQVFFGF